MILNKKNDKTILTSFDGQGLKIRATLDEGHYPHGIKVSDEDFAAINLRPESFHGEWNSAIAARTGD